MSDASDHIVTWTDDYLSEAPCLACGVRATRSSFLTVDGNIWFRCAECSSAFVSPFTDPNYCDDYGFDDYAAYYCQMGAGLEFMNATLEAVRCERRSSFLEVGCGYGFTLHYAREMLGWDVAGVDPAPYSQEGAKFLDVAIDHTQLGNGSVYDNCIFDIVMASELIEHLLDPMAFTGILRRHLSKEGICILTTPNVDALRPSLFARAIAAAFPGFHCTCFSAVALRNILCQSGFDAIEIVETPDRLIAYASPSPSGLNRLRRNARMDAGYLEVLRKTVNAGAVHVHIGAAYRQFRDAVTSGDHLQAIEQFGKLEQLVGEQYSLANLDPIMLRARARIDGPRAFGTTIPYIVPTFAYFAGVLAQQQEQFQKAKRWFATAIELSDILAVGDISSRWWAEAFALYREAQLASATALLSLGQITAAKIELQNIIRAAREPNTTMDNLHAPVGAVVEARAEQQLGVANARVGMRHEAAEHLHSSVAMARVCGADVLAEQSARLLVDLNLEPA